MTFQKESLSVIFEEDWRDRAEVLVSANSTMWIASIAMLISILAFLSARALSLRRVKTGQNGKGSSAARRASRFTFSKNQ
jgi:hypothetical protein